MTRPIDTLLGRLDSAKSTGAARWIAKCPAHKDRRASLSIRELDDGRVLCHCFAGCEVEAVVGSVGLQLEDLFPPRNNRPPGSGAGAGRRPFSARELVAALGSELGVAWVVLGDVEAGRELSAKDRKRAGLARVRCEALIHELRNVN